MDGSFLIDPGGEVAEMIRQLEVLESPAECCTALAATGMSEGDAETTAEVFKALGDPTRIRIVNLLANAPGPACVCDLTDEVELSQPTVSFHLKKLVSAGLLEREQRGVWAFYSVNREALGRLATIFTMEEVSA
jgi:ArsR family transcriptional regulator